MKINLVRRSISLFDNLKNLKFIIPLLFIFCFLAYGLTLDMYFWKDDFALMIKAQHPQEPVGFFGPGIKGDGAYRYIATPFTLLYPYLGLNAWAYFLIGILLYFVAATGLFILALEIFEDKFKAFLTALIFSSGFIGADSIFGLTNSYQTSWVISFLTISLSLFIKSFKTHNLGLYILSVFAFVISVETGFIRAHGFFLIIFSTVFLFVDKNVFKKIPEFFLKITPFFLVFKFFYLNSDPAQVGLAQFSKSLESGKYNYFFNPLITFVNVFLSTPIIKWSLSIVNKVIGRNINVVKYQLVLLFIFILSLVLLTGFLLVRKQLIKKNSENRRNLSILFFSLSLTFGSFIGVFYIGAASSYLESTHRYLSTALIGVAFFWVSLFSLIFSLVKYKAVNYGILAAVLIISLSYLVLGNLYALESINNRTQPQKEFFFQLKKELPKIEGKIFLYFDVSNKNNSQGKFGNIFGAGSVGGSPEITMHYPGVDRYDVVTVISDFGSFVGRLRDNNATPDKVYAFYFENNKLINKSQKVREILEKGKTVSLEPKGLNQETKLTKRNNEYVVENTELEFPFDGKEESITDGILSFDLTIIPTEISNLQSQKSSSDDVKYLRYLLSKSEIKKNSEANVFNHFQTQVAENLFDNKLETSWMADRGPWHNLTHGITDQIQFIEISLPQPIEVGGILFTNGHELRTPTEYRILIKDAGIWKEIKRSKLSSNKATNEIWFEKIEPVFANSVRVELLDSISGDAPQITELELVEDQFSDLDFKKAQVIESDPSTLLKTNPNSENVREYFRQNGKISFVYFSNKDEGYNSPPINFNVKGFYQPQHYEVKIPANGLILTEGKFFNLNFPAKYIFTNLKFTNPTRDELISNER